MCFRYGYASCSNICVDSFVFCKVFFFFSSRRRHTRCALVTGVQTCALPICSGYTEHDPRDDLGGVDVARKLVILAREVCNTLEFSDVQSESMVPVALRDIDGADFLANDASLAAPMAARMAAPRTRGGRARTGARFQTHVTAADGSRGYA